MSKTEFNNLIAQARASKLDKSIQKVVPETSIDKNEKQFSFYIDKVLLRKLKSKALEDVGFPKNRTVHNSNLLTLNSNCHDEKQQV
ncbi:hypothetical protein MAR621_02306 [Maribacter dokdonensis]|uniref:hypothetical protein n=1 Tax=Maribacter dokdonensis TaxID=320912 RepID=UPI001B11E824|nr:hypothetical protein [Maribacter dokdonensis]CAG2531778.1 hypothetical protein MAR621_02306 [Maribacter dokdonensis]